MREFLCMTLACLSYVIYVAVSAKNHVDLLLLLGGAGRGETFYGTAAATGPIT